MSEGEARAHVDNPNKVVTALPSSTNEVSDKGHGPKSILMNAKYYIEININARITVNNIDQFYES